MPYEDISKLFIALVAGAIIGAEREYRSKSAGLRTMTLICVGATLFTMMSAYIGKDTARIAANIVVGIGFLGAGIIYREGQQVRGLTTAAAAWATAALGMCIGHGSYMLALATVLILLMILFLMVPLQNLIERNRQARTYRIVFKQSKGSLKEYESLFKKFHLKPTHVKHSRLGDQITGQWKAYGTEKNHEKFSRHILEDSEIHEFDF